MLKCESCGRLCDAVLLYPFTIKTEKKVTDCGSCIEDDAICLVCLGKEFKRVVSDEI